MKKFYSPAWERDSVSKGTFETTRISDPNKTAKLLGYAHASSASSKCRRMRSNKTMVLFIFCGSRHEPNRNYLWR